MSQTFANTIDTLEIYAKRAEEDQNGLNIDQTYAKKSELPTVNDGTLTIQKNGTTVDTFTANSSSNKTVNIEVPTKTSDLTNDSGFIDAGDIPAQVQSNWNETDNTDPSYIQNKPSIPAAQVNSDWNASSGVAEILNKPSIPTATSDLTNDSGFITASDVPASQEQADWNESDSNDPAYIKNKPSIPAAQVNSDWNASSGVAEILNKPSIPTATSDLTNDSGYITANDVPGSQVQANWSETDTSDPSYIQNKPSIPAAQVNSDWNASSGVAEILNKPSIPTATSDLTNDSGFITASDVPSSQEQADWNEADSSDPAYIKNKPSIPAAQVNSDWNASSGVAEILNKPSIPSATSDLQNDSGFITASDVPAAQEQADWNESDSSDPAYIKNKPSIPAAQVNSDWNASSGVAEILNKPTIRNVPDVGSTDDGKILKATYSGGVGSYAWDNAEKCNVVIINGNSQSGISNLYPTLQAMIDDITAGREIIIKYTVSGVTKYYTFAYVDTYPYFVSFESTTTNGIRELKYAWGRVTTNLGFSIYNYYAGFYPKSWVTSNGSTPDFYVPIGSYTAGYYLFVRNSDYEPVIYKCVLDYTQETDRTLPSSDSTHWQRVYLMDIINDIITAGIPSGGSNGQVLTQTSNGPSWEDVPTELPSGGTAGQVLTKTANGEEWANVPAQVQSDWNESDSSDPAYIQNKPTIPSAQVNSDWNASSGVAEILNKPTIRNVPAVTSSDNSKVLKATYSGGVGSYSWENESGGGNVSIEIVEYSDIETRFNNDFDNLKNLVDSGVYVIIKDVGGSPHSNHTIYYGLSAVTTNVISFESTYIGGDFDAEWLMINVYKTTGSPLLKQEVSRSSYMFEPFNWIFTRNNMYDIYIPQGYYPLNYIMICPDTTSSVKMFRCKSAYTETSSTNTPGGDTLHWEIIQLDDLNHGQIYRYTLAPETVNSHTNTIQLTGNHNNGVIISTGDVANISLNSDANGYPTDIDSVVIQWTVSSVTTLPVIWNSSSTTWSQWTGLAASANPTSLTVGKTYQLSILNNCYSIVEFG